LLLTNLSSKLFSCHFVCAATFLFWEASVLAVVFSEKIYMDVGRALVDDSETFWPSLVAFVLVRLGSLQVYVSYLLALQLFFLVWLPVFFD